MMLCRGEVDLEVIVKFITLAAEDYDRLVSVANASEPFTPMMCLKGCRHDADSRRWGKALMTKKKRSFATRLSIIPWGARLFLIIFFVVMATCFLGFWADF